MGIFSWYCTLFNYSTETTAFEFPLCQNPPQHCFDFGTVGLSCFQFLERPINLIHNSGIANVRWKCCFRPTESTPFKSIIHEWVTHRAVDFEPAVLIQCCLIPPLYYSNALLDMRFFQERTTVWHILLFKNVHGCS